MQRFRRELSQLLRGPRQRHSPAGSLETAQLLRHIRVACGRHAATAKRIAQRRVEASRNDHHVWSKGAGDWHDDLFKGRDIFGISHEPIAPPDVDLSPETKGERGNRSNPASHERETIQERDSSREREQREEERRERAGEAKKIGTFGSGKKESVCFVVSCLHCNHAPPLLLFL